ncbi:MAG: DUF2190 family protein [Oscillospiraceae bacterium]|nr:DUF2190 family protein [Oscillospiraceae bacterium]
MAKEYLNAFVNNSATIRGTLKAAITGAPHKAVAFDSDGTVKLPAADGDPAVGLILSSAPGGTDGSIAAGEDVDILIKDIGLGEASAAIAKGAAVSVTTSGTLATAGSGDFILGFALTAASAEGDLLQVQITKSGYVPSA